jgi:hypothetical protein
MRKTGTYLALGALITMISGCSPQPAGFDKLKIQVEESGPVPASMEPEAPTEEGVIKYTRENAGILKVLYRKTLDCPTRMINSVSGIKVLPDRIQLCFEPVESDDPAARPFSACPYDLVIRYELRGIPKSVEPNFEITDHCTPPT